MVDDMSDEAFEACTILNHAVRHRELMSSDLARQHWAYPDIRAFPWAP
jgi:hypothetical protein